MNTENMPNAEFIIKECGEALGDQSLKSLYQIATGIRDIVDQRDELVEALEEISDPIRFMRERLEEGEQLDGMAAVQIAQDASYLRGIARAALAAHRKQGDQP